jgi:hypothetical protein
MATYDRSMALAGEARLSRHLHLSWSAVLAGALIGWGALFALGPARGVSGFWGVLATLFSFFVAGACAVRIAGERRRRESLLHAAVVWGLDAALLAFLARSTALAFGPLVFSLVTAMLGALAACSRVAGLPFVAELRRQVPRHEASAEDLPGSEARSHETDQPTILPPLH